MRSEVTASVEPKSLDRYPYVGMALCGDQIVLFGDRCSGVVLSGNRAGEYSTSFIESMYEPIGTTLEFSGSNYVNGKYPLVTQGDDGLSVYFLPYRLYFSQELFMAFDVHDNGSVVFTGNMECDYTSMVVNESIICIDIDLHFS